MMKQTAALLIGGLLLSGNTTRLAAQHTDKPGSKHKKAITLKITTDDDGKEQVSIDTLIVSDFHDSLDLHNLCKGIYLEALEKSLPDMEISLDLHGDSLDSLEKHIEAVIKMDGKDFPHFKGFEDMDFSWVEPGDSDSGPGDMDLRLFDGAPGGYQVPGYSPGPGAYGQGDWMQGFSPWGKIREIKVKDRKHGKKVVIRTEDSDVFFFSAVPPVPPIPCQPGCVPKKVKKVIIKKHDKEEEGPDK